MAATVDQKIRKFFANYNRETYKKNHILIHANQNPNCVYKVVAGQVRQYDITEQGNKVVVNIFKPPAYFPMSWAVNKTPNLYYYETVTDTILRKAPPEDVINFIKDNPDVLYELLSRVYLGREVIMRRMAHSMGGKAKTRILFELLLEAQRFGEHQRFGSSIKVPIHVSDIAIRTGLSRETASRELAKMKHLGIKTSSKGIKIKSFESLENELGDSL